MHSIIKSSGRKAPALASAIAGAAVLLLLLSGCSTPRPSPPSGSERSAQEASGGVSSWFWNKFRVCVSNKTGENVTLRWSEWALGDDGEYLSPDELNHTLGPDAFTCATSFDNWGNEDLSLWVPNNSLRTLFHRNSSTINFVPGPALRDGGHLYEGRPTRGVVGFMNGRKVVGIATVSYELRQFGEIEAFPVELVLIFEN